MPSDNIPLDQHSPPKKGAGRYLLSTLLVFTILTAGAFFAFSLVKSGPKAKRAPAVRRARLVEVTPVRFSNHRVIVEGMGTVKPAREINLYARVSGEIQWVSPSFVPGGLLTAGEKMLQIDAADYSLAVRERMAALNQANSNLKIELGQQSVALREFELLGESVRAEDRDLVLRLPQLESVRADVEKAKSQLKKAKLDLERTKITAPFNTVINTREADLGEAITPATKLATLAGTDAYWIETLIPVRQLQWLEVPGLNSEEGATVRVYDPAAWGDDRFRPGQVVRLAGTLEAEGRMAKLLVSVPDPLGLKANRNDDVPVLLMGAFVRVEMEGRSLNHVAAIRREWLRDGDTVWLMNKQNALEIRPLQIAYRGRGQVFASGGLREGERVVVTDLATPVEGMPLRTGEEAGQNASPPQAPISRDTGTP